MRGCKLPSFTSSHLLEPKVKKQKQKNLKDYFTVKIAPGSSFLTLARFIDAAAEQTTSLKQ